MFKSPKPILLLVVSYLLLPHGFALPFISRLAQAIFPSRSTSSHSSSGGLQWARGSPIHPFRPNNDNPLLKLRVNIPQASVNYGKELDVKAGGHFTLETPMDSYKYSSSGNVHFKCAIVEYLMQSSYSPDLMCFYLHFLTYKHKQGLCYLVPENYK